MENKNYNNHKRNTKDRKRKKNVIHKQQTNQFSVNKMKYNFLLKIKEEQLRVHTHTQKNTHPDIEKLLTGIRRGGFFFFSPVIGKGIK